MKLSCHPEFSLYLGLEQMLNTRGTLPLQGTCLILLVLPGTYIPLIICTAHPLISLQTWFQCYQGEGSPSTLFNIATPSTTIPALSIHPSCLIFLHIIYHLLIYSVREGNSTPLQYSCLENPMDGGGWWAAVYGVPQSQTQLKRRSSSSKYTL